MEGCYRQTLVEIGLAAEVAGGTGATVPPARPLAVVGVAQAPPETELMPLTSAFSVCSCFGRLKWRTPGMRTLSAPVEVRFR